MGAVFCECSSCGREFKVKYLKRRMCRECNREDEDSVDAEWAGEVSTPAEDHDRAYNGEEIDDVEINE